MSESAEGSEVPPHLRAEFARTLHGIGMSGGDPRDGPKLGQVGPAQSSPSETDGWLSPGTEIDRFMILRRIGGGGQGDVYAAYDPRLDRRVALKLIRLGTGAGDELQNARLLREAHALARLEHPNVVRVHDTGSHGAAAFLVMEFKRSLTLTRWLEGGTRRWREIVEKFHAVGRGLRAAHARGIVHRDVKADNIFVDDNVGAVLGDFGLALGIGDRAAHSDSNMRMAHLPTSTLQHPMTARDQIPGTEGYIAPEAMRGRATALSDQYSFCVAMFHALFGLMARPDEDRWPTRPHDRVPRRVVKVLHRGLSRDPAERFADMGALLAALPMQPGRRLALLVGAGLVAAVAGASFATWRNPAICSDVAEAQLAKVWNDEREDAVKAGFSRVALPFSERTSDSFVKLVDDYTVHWQVERASACANSSVNMSKCLEDQLDRLDKFLTNYRVVDGRKVERALDAFYALDPPSICKSPNGSERTMPEDLRASLVDAEMAISSGEFSGAALKLDSIRATVNTHPLARTRLLYLEGWLFAARSPDKRSDRMLSEAMLAASEMRDADTFARASIYRLNSLVSDLGALSEARMVEELIENTWRWWPEDASVRQRFDADLAESRGARLDEEGETGQAIAALRSSLASRVERDGKDHPRVAKAHHNLAVALTGDPNLHDEARWHYARAYFLRDKWFGEDHPYTLESEYGLAQFECEDMFPPPGGRSNIAPDCAGDLEADLALYEASSTLDPRGLRRRRVTLANLEIRLGNFARAEEILASADASAGSERLDVREQSDLFAVRGKLAEKSKDVRGERIAYTASLEALEAGDRRDSLYFTRMRQAVKAAVKEWRGDVAARLVLQRRDGVLGGGCLMRLAYAGVVEDLMNRLAVGPDREIEELQVAAKLARYGCEATEKARSEAP